MGSFKWFAIIQGFAHLWQLSSTGTGQLLYIYSWLSLGIKIKHDTFAFIPQCISGLGSRNCHLYDEHYHNGLHSDKQCGALCTWAYQSHLSEKTMKFTKYIINSLKETKTAVLLKVTRLKAKKKKTL